jgi:hypothetical protein
VEVSGELHAAATLPPGKHPLCTPHRRLGESQSWPGLSREQKNLAERGDIGLMAFIHIQELVAPNLGQDFNYREWGFS